jgi:hypothetical protein
MAVANLHMGYVGGAKINNVNYFMSSSSLNPNQTVEAPDLVAGSIMRRGWVYGKVDPGGTIAGPLHENAKSLWPTAFNRTSDYDHLANTVPVEVHFYKGGGWKFDACVINKLDIAASAGETVTFTADFAAKGNPGGGNPGVSSSSTEIDCAKLMTWDRVNFEVSGVTGLEFLQSVNFSLNNNVQKLFAIRGDGAVTDLYPVDLPCGVREITGTISAYASNPIGDFLTQNIGADSWNDYTAENASKDITFTVSGGSGDIIDINFEAVFNRPEGTGGTGAAVYNLGFTAVCEPSGETV